MLNFAASALALLSVLVLAYYVIKAGAKFNGMKQRGNGIQVLETTAVGSRERLVLVSFENQRYLLGVTAHNVSVVSELSGARTQMPVQLHDTMNLSRSSS